MQITKEEYLDRFRAAATGDPKPARDFFTCLPFIAAYSADDYLRSFNQAIDSLTELKGLDPDSYKRIHKGYIFYFTAISAFKLHDFNSACFFFDAAAAEDMKNAPGERTPSLLFMVLDGKAQTQAAQEQTALAERWLRASVDYYNKCAGSVAVTTEDIRRNLLERAITDRVEWRTLVTAWITFLVEWGHRFVILNLRAEEGTWEPFYLHLFKGCLLFESLLKSEPTGQVMKTTLGGILNGSTYARARLGIGGQLDTGNTTLLEVLQQASTAPTDVSADILLVARLRNTLGHNLGWATSLGIDSYSSLARRVSNCCLHVMSTMYR